MFPFCTLYIYSSKYFLYYKLRMDQNYSINQFKFFPSACTGLIKNNNFQQQGLQIAALQQCHYKCKSENYNLSGEIGNNFYNNPNFALKILSWVIWSNRKWTYMFLKVFYEKSSQTDVSKEMCIPILKGLKHLNTVSKFLPSLDYHCSWSAVALILCATAAWHNTVVKPGSGGLCFLIPNSPTPAF